MFRWWALSLGSPDLPFILFYSDITGIILLSKSQNSVWTYYLKSLYCCVAYGMALCTSDRAVVRADLGRTSVKNYLTLNI